MSGNKSSPFLVIPAVSSGEWCRRDRDYLMRKVEYLMRRLPSIAGDNEALQADFPDIMSALQITYDGCSEDDAEQCRLFITAVLALARFLGYRNALDDRIKWGERALPIAERLEENLAISELCGSTICWPLLQQGKLEDAERYSLRGLEAALRHDDLVVGAKWAGSAARTLSGVARDRKDGETAYYWAGRAAEYAIISQDELLIRGAELDFGYAALIRGDFVEAEQRFSRLANFEESKADKDIERLANRTGDLALAIMNQAVRAEDGARKTRLCLRVRAIYERCLSLSQAIEHRVAVAEAESGLAMVALALGDEREHERLTTSCHRGFAELGIIRESRAEQFITFPANGND